MTPAVKGLIALVGVAAVSAAVVFAVLAFGSRPRATDPAIPSVTIDNGVRPTDDPLRPDYRVELLSIPAFSQRSQSGQVVTNATFTGRLTVVSFFFTRCTFICPALTGAMLELMDRLKDTPAQFLSFTVDPAHDTPEVIKQYAEQHGADLTRWTLLCGSREETWSLLRNGLKWGIEEREEERIILADGTTIANIRHPGWFALVGPDGRVLGIYQSSDDEQIAALEARVRAAIARLPRTP